MNTMQKSVGVQNPKMKSFRVPLTLPALILFSAITAGLLDCSTVISSSRADASAEQTVFDKREAAYRANNLGVALLEQYKAKEAVESFTRALEIKSDLLIARINLSIALYYLPDAEGAKREAEKALTQDANAPQPRYILGLIARAQNRFDEAIAEFEQVLKIDSDDVGANVNLGQIFVQQIHREIQHASGRNASTADRCRDTRPIIRRLHRLRRKRSDLQQRGWLWPDCLF